MLPRVCTESVTASDIAVMSAALEARGLRFCDPGIDNLGRLDGRLVVLDPGAVDPPPDRETGVVPSHDAEKRSVRVREMIERQTRSRRKESRSARARVVL